MNLNTLKYRTHPMVTKRHSALFYELNAESYDGRFRLSQRTFRMTCCVLPTSVRQGCGRFHDRARTSERAWIFVSTRSSCLFVYSYL